MIKVSFKHGEIMDLHDKEYKTFLDGYCSGREITKLK
jgi:hypothetical protein